MHEATWAAFAATLTLLGLGWTWVAYRRRGAVSALRALGFTTLPAAAWLTGTLEMASEIAGSVTDWATGLVFNPITWSGITLAGFGVVLIVVSGILRDRQLASLDASGSARASRRAGRRSLPPARATGVSAKGADPDDEMDDIESILKRRGIT